MSNKNEPAFPVVQSEPDYDRRQERHFTNIFSTGGLTKRELFAAMALQGMWANSNTRLSDRQSGKFVSDELAKVAVLQADSLIEELDKESK